MPLRLARLQAYPGVLNAARVDIFLGGPILHNATRRAPHSGVHRPLNPALLSGHNLEAQKFPSHTEAPLLSFRSSTSGSQRSSAAPTPEMMKASEHEKPPGSSGSSKIAFTHFLSIPLDNTASVPSLARSLARLADDITSPRPPAPDPTFTSESHTSTDPLDLLIPQASNHTGDAPDSALPTTAPALAEATTTQVLNLPIPRSAVRPTSCVHLTLGVMNLNTPEKLEEALHILRDIDLSTELRNATALSTIVAADPDTAPLPLQMNLVGLHSHRPLDSTMSLHAALIDETGRLLPFCEAIREKFNTRGLLTYEKRGFSPHVTLLSMFHAFRPDGTIRNGRAGIVVRRVRGGEARKERGGVKVGKGSPSLDARELAERWKEERWAEVELERLCICKKGVSFTDGVEKYMEVEDIKI